MEDKTPFHQAVHAQLLGHAYSSQDVPSLKNSLEATAYGAYRARDTLRTFEMNDLNRDNLDSVLWATVGSHHYLL
jgi:hypothetical protein